MKAKQILTDVGNIDFMEMKDCPYIIVLHGGKRCGILQQIDNTTDGYYYYFQVENYEWGIVSQDLIAIAEKLKILND